MEIAVLDTSVLFPLLLRDTLLDLAQARLYVVHWSPDILDELARNLVKRGQSTEEQAARLVAAMNRVFPGALVTGYEHRIAAMTNHPKDRHVLAAAVEIGATVIVTTNLRDFRPAALEPHNLMARSPDAFLGELATRQPARVATVLREQAARYRSPAMTFDHLLEKLRLHAPTLVSRLSAMA
jgi:predicted nucleic acid-binding protein